MLEAISRLPYLFWAEKTSLIVHKLKKVQKVQIVRTCTHKKTKQLMGPHPIMPIDNILINIHKEWHGNIVDSYKLYPFPGPNLHAPDPLRTALC